MELALNLVDKENTHIQSKEFVRNVDLLVLNVFLVTYARAAIPYQYILISSEKVVLHLVLMDILQMPALTAKSVQATVSIVTKTLIIALSVMEITIYLVILLTAV
jgi:hypothetical protein